MLRWIQNTDWIFRTLKRCLENRELSWLKFNERVLEIGEEALKVFQAILLGKTVDETEYLLVAPKCLQKPVLDLIDKEIQMTKEKKAAYIGIKINSLTDKRNISISAALWDAIWNIPESTYLEQKTGIRSTSHLRIS